MNVVRTCPEQWCQSVRPYNIFMIGSEAHHIANELPYNYLYDRTQLGSVLILPSEDSVDGIELLTENSAQVHVDAGNGYGDPQDLVSVRNTIGQYREALTEMVQGASINVICTTLGDSFPSGVAPVISNISAQTGAVTVGLIALPHPDKGHKFQHHSKWALEYTRPNLDSMILLPMEEIYSIVAGSTMTQNVGVLITQILSRIMRGILDVMTVPAFGNNPNADDIAAFFRGAGEILVAYQEIEHVPNGPYDAIRRCINKPFHSLRRFEGAQKVLVSVCCGEAGLQMEEYLRIGQSCRNELGNETDIIVCPFSTTQRGERPFIVVYGRDIIEKRRDGFDYPVAELPPEKAPPELPAFYRKFYGASRSILSHDVSNF